MKGEKKKSFEKNDGPLPLLSAGALSRHRLNQIVDTEGDRMRKVKMNIEKIKQRPKILTKRKENTRMRKHESEKIKFKKQIWLVCNSGSLVA
ncbi:unnamed protein product [Camellia sinensis]